METKVFISYRRDDTGLLVGRISEHLEKHFGAHSVFLDVDRIPPGVDFRHHLRATLTKCTAAVILIGHRWSERTEQGRVRLEEKSDFVRLEIEAVLPREIPVVPVLVDGASLPAPNELPNSLQPLLHRQAFLLGSGRDFAIDIDRLANALTHQGVVARAIRGHSALFWAMWAGEFMLSSAASQVAREGEIDLGSLGGGSLEECLSTLGVETPPSASVTDELRASIRQEIEQKHGQEVGEAFQLGWVSNLAAFVCGMPPTLNAARHEIERSCHRIGVPDNIRNEYILILDDPSPEQGQVLRSLKLFKKRLLPWLDVS